MERTNRFRQAWVGCVATFLLAAGAARGEGAAKDLRVVACDAQLQSHKRGVCANHLKADDFRVLAPGVSWWYNWHFKSDDAPPEGVAMDFVPMAWGDRPGDLTGLSDYLGNHTPRAVLAINEPNLRGQAFIDPEKTAALFDRIKAVADEHHLPVVGPNMALGSGKESSIKAFDPIEKKEVTYTWMVPFLKAVAAFPGAAGQGYPALAVHPYGDINEMRWAVGALHKEFNCPIWVTEFAQWKSKDDAAACTYMVQAVDFLERTPYVQGYAWFKERIDSNPRISLLTKETGKLSPFGETYVAMPVHDADVYYKLPGKLSGARYATMKNMEVFPADEGDEKLPLYLAATDGGASATYQVYAEKAGKTTLHVRVGRAAGKMDVVQDGNVVASISSDDKAWSDAETSIVLKAGAQSLTLATQTKGLVVRWITFE